MTLFTALLMAALALPRLPEFVPNQVVVWPYEDNVVARKIYIGDDSRFSRARYVTSVWAEQGESSVLHCETIGICGEVTHVFVTKMRIGLDVRSDAYLLYESDPTHFVWKAF